jgi:hypothetical protein
MPALIRCQRLLAAMHPRASAACSVYCGSSKAPKKAMFVAAKAKVFVDAPQVGLDTLVHGNDVFHDPQEAPQPKSSNEDPSTWPTGWREVAQDEIIADVNPGDLIHSSTGKQGPKVKESRYQRLQVPWCWRAHAAS